MTPILGKWPIRCRSCQAVAYLGDTPLSNLEAALTELGDSRCPRGGVDCPSTSEAVAARQPVRTQITRAMGQIGGLQAVSGQLAPIAEAYETAHAALSARITALENRVPVIRVASVAIATLLAGTSATVTAIWPNPLPTAVYDVAVSNQLVVTSVVSRTVTAATVTVRTTTLLAATTVIFVSVGWSA